jgi:hypothetical protein
MIASPMPSATSQLSRRVEMLLSRSKKNSATSIVFAVFCVIVISVVGLWVSNASPLFAVTDDNKSVTIAQNAPVNAAVAEEETFANNDDFQAASQRMKEAREKMESAREEMYRAAESMRKSHHETHSCEGVECEETKELEHEHWMNESDANDSMRQHERNMRHHERDMRHTDREIEEETPELPELAELPETPPPTTAPAVPTVLPAFALVSEPLSPPAPTSALRPVVVSAPPVLLPPTPQVPPAPKTVPKPEKPPKY